MRKKIVLSEKQVNSIHETIDKAYDLMLARFFDRPPVDKSIFIGYKPRVTLPYLFRSSLVESGAKPSESESVINSLMRSAEGYVNSQREAVKSRVTKAVENWLNTATVKTDIDTILGGQLADVWKSASNSMLKIIQTEATTVRNTGALDGIVKVNAASGIEDPVVYFIVLKDTSTCDECTRLHLLEDGITPKLWYLSQLGHGYHKKGDSFPKLGGLHPHCRCQLATLMPGFGFEAGKVTFVGHGHNEYERQNMVIKTEQSQEVIVPEIDLPEKTKAAELPPLLDNSGRLVIGSNQEFESFYKSVSDGVVVAFRGSKTDLTKDELCKLVPDVVQSVVPNARLFARGKTFKIFVPNQLLADSVVSAIQSAILDGDDTNE